MIRLSQDGETIRVSHVWGHGSYDNRIPQTTVHDLVASLAKQRGEEDLAKPTAISPTDREPS